MKVRIGLKSHQQPMAEKLDSLYSQGKNFAGVILATGGGKSFLAMDQIIKFAENYNARNPITEEQERENPRLLSAVSGYYVCPQNPISLQFRIHMISNIIGPEHIIRYEEKNGPIQEGQEIQVVKDIMQTMAPELNLEKIEFEKLLAEVNERMSEAEDVQKSAVVQKMIAEIVSQYQNKDLKKVVDAAFPNFNFITYKSLENKTDKDFKEMKADFIIIDEAHRSGAEKWWPKIQSFIRNSGAKVLSITATPERDVDEKDMMRDLALLETSGYSVREVRKKEHLAGNMPLLSSIEGGHIAPPDVVHFNCKLDETPEFEDAVRAYIQASIKVQSIRTGTDTYYNAMNAKLSIENALARMLVLTRKDPLIDYDDTLTPEEKEARKKADEDAVKEQVNGTAKYGENKVTILSQINDIINNGRKAKTPEDQIFAQCMEVIHSPEWETLKDERVATIISKEIKGRKLENYKAINFMEAMEGKAKESKEEKAERARVHIENQISKLKRMIDTRHIAMPTFFALHSTAFTDKENEDTLEEFMERNKSGVMKIISAVSKFNEGFHADGVRALLMTTPIQPNENKESEPRIKLLQQIGRCLSAGKTDVSVIFDTACNFMRNHEKFKAECEKECFAFLRLSKEEEEFKQLSSKIKTTQRATAEKKPDADKLIEILEVLKNNNIKVDSDKIPDGISLSEYIQTIADEETREKVLDDLYLREIELESDGEFELGYTYRYARNVYLGRESDPTTLKKLSPKTLKEMLDLGIIETQTKEGLKSLDGRINRAGFVVRGVVAHTFAQNVFTGTEFDGPETDQDRKDYFGCGPDGRDSAGYDKYGFDRDGIHRVTGKHYDERFFVPIKGADGSITWSYEDPKTGARTETDPLGFDHDGIDPRTGFDRDGYWHRQNEDGTFSITKSRLNPEKMDAHNFLFKSVKEKLGELHGIKGLFRTKNGLFSNGTISQDGDGSRYGNDEFDIDGFDKKGFNADGFHRDTSTEYGLDGKDRTGRMQVDLKIASEILVLLKSKKIKPEDLPKRLGRTPEEVDRVLGNAFSISRTLIELQRKKDPKANAVDVIGLVKMTKEDPAAVDALFKLSPSMRKQLEKALLDNRTMNEYYSRRTGEIIKELQKGNNIMKIGEQEELTELAKGLDTTTGSVEYRKSEEEDFII